MDVICKFTTKLLFMGWSQVRHYSKINEPNRDRKPLLTEGKKTTLKCTIVEMKAEPDIMTCVVLLNILSALVQNILKVQFNME